MRVSTTQQSLAKALSITARAVSSRTTMPVLSNILLEVKDDQLRLAATNREIAINCWIAATVEDEGAITIPARLLSEFVNSLPPERIDMELTARTKTLHLSCARFEANMKGIDAFEFPLIPTYQPESVNADVPLVLGDAYTIDPATLVSLINSVTFAASHDENRPTLTGVETTFDGGKIVMAATDGYRLSVRSAESGQGEKNTVVIPSRNLSEVARICGDATGDITTIISQNRNQIIFSATGGKEWQRVDIVSELIDARFPDYMQTVPKTHTTRTVVDTSALLKAVRVALLFARDNANIVVFSVDPTEQRLRLAATSAEMGDNAGDIECAADGPPIEIRYNAKYMIDYLSQVDAPQVVMETTQPTRPGLFRPAGADGYIHCVMPLQPPK